MCVTWSRCIKERSYISALGSSERARLVASAFLSSAGAADAAEDADARVLAREWIRDQDDLRTIVAAMPLAAALIAHSEMH